METKLHEYEVRQCIKHGEYKSYLVKYRNRKGWSDCTQCTSDNIKLERSKSESNINMVEHRRRFLKNHAGIPHRYENASFDKYQINSDQQQRIINRLIQYIDNFNEMKAMGICLGLIGGVGTGKTYLACAMALKLIEKDFSPLFILTKELINDIRATWHRDSLLNEEFVKRKYINADLLILDEIGVQMGSENEKNILFEIINGRYLKTLPTVIISNLDTPDELQQYLGIRSYDRLKENGGKLLIFNWQSHRGAAS